MLNPDVRRRIDAIWDAVWSSGITNPLTAVEYISTLLLVKRLQDRTGGERETSRNLERAIAQDDVDAITRLLSQVRLEFGVGASPDIAANSTWHDTATLRAVLEAVLKLTISDRNHDILGDVFEYMLNHLNTAGQFGQFRTPRHLVQLMVQILDPQPGEVVLDPACGTAGFLVAAHEHRGGSEQTYIGHELDATIHRIASSNCQLHNMTGADIRHTDALTCSDRDADVILANPPFAGAVIADRVSAFESGSLKTELLFMELMMRRLKLGGRAAAIVPNGVITSTAASAVWVRRQLLEANHLRAVIELPNGVFRPYTDVRTAVLIWSNDEPGRDVVLMRVENDGYSLDDRRTPTKGSDFPGVLSVLQHTNASGAPPHAVVSTSDIAAEQYVLSPNRYIAQLQDTSPEATLSLDEALSRAGESFLGLQSALEQMGSFQ